MGLDIYAGSVTRYVAGDWSTIVQQAAAASGVEVVMLRQNEPQDVERDVNVISAAVLQWQDGLLTALGGGASDWIELADAPYSTDKPDWDGYGAVVLLAAYLERPELAPGTSVRRGLRRSNVEAVLPRAFGDSDAFKAASQDASRFPTLLRGVEWCLPIGDRGRVFEAPAPNGKRLTMGNVDQLVAELHDLNAHSLQLSPAAMDAARAAGPPAPGTAVEDVAPFGLSVMTALAEFAAVNRLCWIMDY